MRRLSSTVHPPLTRSGHSRGMPWRSVAAVLTALVAAAIAVFALDWAGEPRPQVDTVRLEAPAEGFDRLTTTTSSTPPLEVVPPPVSLEPAPPTTTAPPTSVPAPAPSPPPPPPDDDDDDGDDRDGDPDDDEADDD